MRMGSNRNDAKITAFTNITDNDDDVERPLLINNEEKLDPDQLTSLIGIKMKQSTKKEIEISLIMIIVIIFGSANRVANNVYFVFQPPPHKYFIYLNNNVYYIKVY